MLHERLLSRALIGLALGVCACSSSSSSSSTTDSGQKVVCGSSGCEVACCLATDAGPSCTDVPAACPGGGRWLCDGPEDCPGQRCCLTFQSPPNHSFTDCEDQCPGATAEV